MNVARGWRPGFSCGQTGFAFWVPAPSTLTAVGAAFAANGTALGRVRTPTARRPTAITTLRMGSFNRNQHPDAIQIVDLFHAKEKIAIVAKTIFGEHSDLVRPWRKLRFAELDRGDLQALLDALSNHRGASKAVCDAIGNFENNRHRMRYGEFQAQGLCVSSGVVEAGCKKAFGARLKRPGMHWSVAGANAILALRCYVLSRRFDDFWCRKNVS